MFRFPDGSQLLEVYIHGGPIWQTSGGTRGLFDPGGGHWSIWAAEEGQREKTQQTGGGTVAALETQRNTKLAS